VRPVRPLPVLGVLIVAVLLAACGNPSPTATPSASVGSADLFPVPISTQLVAGDNRFVFSFLDKQNQPVASPDQTASVQFIPQGQTAPVASGDGRFVWGIEDVRGVYVTNVRLPAAGPYTARFTTQLPGKAAETVDMQLDVLDKSTGIAVGDKAPASKTPTLADVGGDVAKISSDKTPVDRFYETSVADAVAARKPFVLVFATPKFCQSAQCGPTLDHVKNVVAKYPDVTVINVEPYQLEDKDGTLQPVTQGNPPQLVPVQSVLDWGITSEPWIFVVGSDGVVRGSFEGIIAEDELQASIDGVVKG
jgi:hypothetical protein